jgi:hypothetical protein
MSPFQFCLSAAKNLNSFQLLPASLLTGLLQLFLGLPLFLLPWGFQNRAAFGITPSSFLNVWPFHLNFLFLVSMFISSCPVTFHRLHINNEIKTCSVTFSVLIYTLWKTNVFDWLLTIVAGQEVVFLNTENSEIFFHHSKVSCVKNQRINPLFLYPCGKKFEVT